MKFIGLHIQGFRSFVDQVIFSFEDKGITQITGQNGAGKTSLFEALFWALYGEPLKSGSVVENGLKPLEVGVLWEQDGVNYKVTRSQKDLILTEGEIIQTLYKKDTQARIVELLGLTPMQFLNSILMAQRAPRIADYDEKQRREFFESLFDLGWVDELRDRVAEDLKKLNLLEVKNSTSLKSEQTNLENCLRERDRILEEKDKWDYLFDLEVDRLREDIFNYRETLVALEKIKPLIVEVPQEYRNTIEELTAVIQHFQDEINDLNSQTKSCEQRLKLVKDPEEVIECCGSCGREFDEVSLNHAHRIYYQKLVECEKKRLEILAEMPSESQFLELTDYKNEALRKLQEFKTEIFDLELQERQTKIALQEWAASFRTAELKVSAAESAYETHTNSVKPDFDKSLARVENLNISHCKNAIQCLEEESLVIKEALELSSYWNKALGANELKTHITQAYFAKLNVFLAEYGRKFGFQLRFNIDLSKRFTKSELEIWRLDGASVPYGNLSGGEKSRVELALQLALSDLIAPDSNLMIFDESLAGLDKEGLSLCREIFSDLAQKKAVYFISHLQEDTHLYTKTIEVVKTENGSKFN